MRFTLIFLFFLFVSNPVISTILVPNEGKKFFVHICNEEDVQGTITEYKFGAISRTETLDPGQCFSEIFDKADIDSSEVIYVFRSSKSAELFEHTPENGAGIDWENLLYFLAGLLGLAAKDAFTAITSLLIRRIKLGRRLKSFEDRFVEDLKNATLSIEFDDELRRFREGQYDAVAWGSGLSKKAAMLQDLHERVVSGATSNVTALGELGKPV